MIYKYLLNLILLMTTSQICAQTLNPLFSRQWYLINTGQVDTIREGELILREQKGIPGIDINWSMPTKSNKQTIVAVIDSGIDLEHPDLIGRIVPGKNFLHPTDSVQDDTGHGTHISGIIAANNNQIGTIGLAGDNTAIKIMPLKVLSGATKSFSYQGRLITDYFSDAINYAVEKNVDVINMSVGFPILVITDKLINAVKNAYKKNIPIVVAAGNNNKDIPVYPCSFQEVICVGAIDNNGEISEFSNFGSRVDILAPGRTIISTYPESRDSSVLRLKGYEIKRGTSQAAPLVSGIIAVLKSEQKNLTTKEIMARLFGSARSLKSQNKTSTFGLVDMKKAMQKPSGNIFYPHFKNIDQVLIENVEHKFELEIPIQNLTGNNAKLAIQIAKNNHLKLSKHNYELAFKANQETAVLKITAQLSDYNQDHLVPITLKLKADGFEKDFVLNLRFSSSLKIKNHYSAKLKNIDARKILRLSPRKTSYLKYIFSAFKELANPEYFFVQDIDRRSSLVTIGFITVNKDNAQTKTIQLPLSRSIVSVLKGDYNLDQKDDYLLLAREMVNNVQVFYLYYLDENLKPLWGKHSIFKLDPNKSHFKIGSENLLDFDKGKPKFNFVKFQDKSLGNMMVPVITKRGYLPESDNSTDIFNYQTPFMTTREYMLLPNTENQVIEQRVLFSVDRRQEIEEALNLNPWQELRFEGYFKENTLKSGILKALISTGEGLDREYSMLAFTSPQDYQITPIDKLPTNFVLTSNNIFESVNLNGKEDKTIFFSLDGGNEARSIFLNSQGNYFKQNHLSDGWSDPFMGFIGSHYNSADNILWLESRYYIHQYKNQEKSSKIAVNRESSFPGVEFSESMRMIKLKVDQELTSAVFVNSTLLYGDQLYLVTNIKDQLARPISQTLFIPKNCSYMDPAFNKESNTHFYVLVCLEDNDQIEIKSIPIDID